MTCHMTPPTSRPSHSPLLASWTWFHWPQCKVTATLLSSKWLTESIRLVQILITTIHSLHITISGNWVITQPGQTHSNFSSLDVRWYIGYHVSDSLSWFRYWSLVSYMPSTLHLTAAHHTTANFSLDIGWLIDCQVSDLAESVRLQVLITSACAHCTQWWLVIILWLTDVLAAVQLFNPQWFTLAGKYLAELVRWQILITSIHAYHTLWQLVSHNPYTRQNLTQWQPTCQVSAPLNQSMLSSCWILPPQKKSCGRGLDIFHFVQTVEDNAWKDEEARQNIQVCLDATPFVLG